MREFSCKCKPHSSTLEPDRQQPGRPAACVIAQKYSPSPSPQLRFHSRTEKFDALKKAI